MSTLLEYLQPLPFSRLVDMGCGTGEFIAELGVLKPQAHLIGIDVDESTIGKAHSRMCPPQVTSKISFVCGDCLNVPSPGGSTDVIVFRGLLHHIEEVGLALVEAHRVLRKGGLLMIQDGKRMSAPLFEEMNEALNQSGLPGQAHPGYNLGNLSEELGAHGLMVEEITEGGVAIVATPPYTPRVYSTGLFLLSARKVKHGAQHSAMSSLQSTSRSQERCDDPFPQRGSP